VRVDIDSYIGKAPFPYIGVYGVVHERGYEEGDCSRQSQQQRERHGSQMISWIVRRTKSFMGLQLKGQGTRSRKHVVGWAKMN